MINELSIIIPTLNEEKYLPKLLDSLANQEFRGNLQVIVVDGHSEDKTVDEANKFSEKIGDLLILETERGLPYQRNKGAERAKYKYLLFIDSDNVLPSSFLSDLTKKLNPDENFIVAILHLPIKPNFLDYLWIAWMFLLLIILRFFDPIVSGSFILTTKEVHKKIGGFTEGVVIGEDVDYGRRSLKAGSKYHLFFQPHVLASPRRVREKGRIGLFILWARCYFYIKKHGPIYDKEKFLYTYGKFQGDN